jgi:ubiquinone/menaquinone biosynthesis C-methylase UbiE
VPDYFDIYAHHAEEYDQLVEREDYEGHLLPALEAIAPFNGRDMVELGAGTGRLTRLLAPQVRSIRAFDSSPAMLEVAVRRLSGFGAKNWRLAAGDNRQVPAESASADVVLSGWSLVYLALEKVGMEELDRGLAEMERIAREDGTIIIIETLGTGVDSPTPPPDLLDYFAHLEVRGFQRSWIRTDYRFHDLEEAQRLARFFFGEEMLNNLVSTDQGALLPECTGLWWKPRRVSSFS